MGSVTANVCEQAPIPVVLLTIDLRGLTTAKRDQRLPGSMAVWLRVFRGIDIANPNADALALQDNVKRVAINHMG